MPDTLRKLARLEENAREALREVPDDELEALAADIGLGDLPEKLRRMTDEELDRLAASLGLSDAT